MESLKMPWSDIEEKFTRSEIVLIGWRSQEISFQLNPPKDKRGRPPRGDRRSRVSVDSELVHEVKLNEEVPEEGMTEAEALEYFGSLGIVFPMMFPK